MRGHGRGREQVGRSVFAGPRPRFGLRLCPGFGGILRGGGPGAFVHEAVELGLVLGTAEPLQEGLERLLLFLQPTQGLGLVVVEGAVAGRLARAHRVTYVGELGWELYVPADQTAHVFETLDEAGAELGLKLCGLHTLDSCRIEKAYRHWGHDITDEDHVLEAGLGFTVSRKKPAFIGREAVLRREQQGLDRKLLQFRLKDPEPLLFHNEAIVRDGKIVGPVTSGAYGHHLGGAIGMGYVPAKGQSDDDILGARYEIEVAGQRHEAIASLAPLYDPKSERIRA